MAVEWDVFISHASEDKESFVRRLANHLKEQGLRVWFDEFTLTVGDSLRRSIDRGLANSRYGIVVISPDFLKKDWPQKELDGLVAREVDGVKVILPVWHNINAVEIRTYSPTLADRLAVLSSKGLDRVSAELLKAIHQSSSTTATPTVAAQAAESAPEFKGPSKQYLELADYASELHKRRVAQLLGAKAPVSIMDGGALAMHVVPHCAISNSPTSAFEAISREPHRLVPLFSSHGLDYRISYDGLLAGSNAEGLSKPQRAYASLSRTGMIEAVASSLAKGREREYRYLVLPEIQAAIIKYAFTYVRTLHSFSVAPPISVCFSLVDVEGFKLIRDFMPYGAIPEDLPCGYLDRNHLDFGQVIFETMPSNYNEAAKALRPILTHLANAAGLHSSPYFDTAGNYELVDKL